MSRWTVLGVALSASISLAGCGTVAGTPEAKSATAPVKVVYHFTHGVDEASRGLGNIRNHLAADPQAKIVVVSNGPGIDFMLAGATDKNGAPFDASISELKSRRVDFRACRNTLTSRKIDPSTINPEVSVIPSGVAEAARLQSREAYSYLRP